MTINDHVRFQAKFYTRRHWSLDPPIITPALIQDLVILVDEHCIPPVFSLETSELCPHVYKHLFSIMSRVLMSCCHVIGDKTVLNTSDSFANKFATKILGMRWNYWLIFIQFIIEMLCIWLTYFT